MKYINFGTIEEAYNGYKYIFFNNAPTNKYGMALYSYTTYYTAFSNADEINEHILNFHGVNIQCQTLK